MTGTSVDKPEAAPVILAIPLMNVVVALAKYVAPILLTPDDLFGDDYVAHLEPRPDGSLMVTVLKAPPREPAQPMHPTMGTASTSPNPPKEQDA